MTIRFTIFGVPATKKTSNVLGEHEGKPKVFPSKTYRKWVNSATVTSAMNLYPGLAYSVNCKALVYRKRKAGDLLGYLQAIADFLELCQSCRQRKCSKRCLMRLPIIENDRWIVGWDGSRMLHDKLMPRVEITLERIDGT